MHHDLRNEGKTMSRLTNNAMHLAMRAHGSQVRKYTQEPYWKHCAEVVALTQSVTNDEEMLAAAWLHDTLEDTDLARTTIYERFGARVFELVQGLTEVPVAGNRAVRKAAECDRLASQCPAVQTIKYADLISNTGSIVAHDPGFSQVYLGEKSALLLRLTQGSPCLRALAWHTLNTSLTKLAA